MDSVLAVLVKLVHQDRIQSFPLTLLVGGKLVDGVLIKPHKWGSLQKKELDLAHGSILNIENYLHLTEARVEGLSVPLLRVIGEQVDAWSLGRVQAWK